MRSIVFFIILSFSLFVRCDQSKQKQNDSENQKAESEKAQRSDSSKLISGDLTKSVSLPETPDDIKKKRNKESRRKSLKKLTKVNLKKAMDTIRPSAALPDFRSFKETKERKKHFIEFMKPVIKSENARIIQKRYLIKQIYRGLEEGESLSDKDRKWLNGLAKEYRVKNRDFPSEDAFLDLLMHVDIIPLDLALAQAANESAWGTSRFARLGNNMFGQWCFKPGCGIVPSQRKEGATHEVAAFNTVAGSAESYMHHVNSHPAYHQLRVLRYQQRVEGKEPDGHTIALGLQKYSAIGMKYVNILRSIMKKQKAYL